MESKYTSTRLVVWKATYPGRRQETSSRRKCNHFLFCDLVLDLVLIMTFIIALGFPKCASCEIPPPLRTSSEKIAPCIDQKTGHVFPWQSYRLPTTISPQHYHIFLHPNFTMETCQGGVTIDLQVHQTTNYVILHVGKNVKLDQVLLAEIKNLKHKTAPHEELYCATNEMMALKFDKPLMEGKTYLLTVRFSYVFARVASGFYLGYYKKPDGSELAIAATQMEPTYARKAFPCFDEPSFKANFSLSMVREKKYHTLFNMPLKSVRSFGNNLEIDDFEITKWMSSYLVAFCVSDFERISTTTRSGVNISLYSTPDKTQQLRLGLDAANKSLTFYEELFAIPYPLPKMDLVALPEFYSGAMENWGLLMFSEPALLFNRNVSTVADVMSVITIVTHEIAHQWFGDLVTMDWWDDIWLNEGFATFMQFYSASKIYPKLTFWNEFAISTMFVAESIDSLQHTHPISFQVTTLKEIGATFDSITYQKGASLISMLANYFGESFFVGLRAYLKKFAYSNASSKDFIEAIGQALKDNKENVNVMMNSWIRQPGMPMVHVSQSRDGEIILRQKRFISQSDDPARVHIADTLWPIPLNYVTDTRPKKVQQYLLKDRTAAISVPFTYSIKFNHNVSAYALITYDKALWKGLSDQLQMNASVFAATDRMSIIYNAFISARADYLSYPDLFALIDFIRNESEYNVVNTAIVGLNYMDGIMIHQDNQMIHKKLQSFSNSLLKSIYEKVAWKDRSLLTIGGSKLQSSVTATLCLNEYRPCIYEALNNFAAWIYNGTTVSPELQYAMLSTAVIHGPPGSWDYIWDRYLHTTDDLLKVRLLIVLAMTRNPEKISLLHEEVLAGVNIKIQYIGKVLRTMFTNRVGASLTWNFMQNEWTRLTKVAPVSGISMPFIIGASAAALNDESEIISATNFYESKRISNLKFVEETLETAWVRLYWVEHRLPQVAAWLVAGR